MLRDDAEYGSSQESTRNSAVKDEPTSPGYAVPFEEVMIKEEKGLVRVGAIGANDFAAELPVDIILEEQKDPFDVEEKTVDPTSSKTPLYLRARKDLFVSGPVIKEETLDEISKPRITSRLVDYSSSSSQDSLSEDDGENFSFTSTDHEKSELQNDADSSFFDFGEAVETETHGSGTSEDLENPGKGNCDKGLTKKRRRDPSTWKCSMRKKAKNLGLEYISARGKYVPAAKMRNPCACSMNCVHRFPEEQRKKVFDAFWGLGDRDMRWDFIRKNSENAPTKQRANDHILKRVVFRNYFFTVDQQRLKVCKQMFMSTLGIWDSVIISAYSHVDQEKGTVLANQMGKHGKNPRKVTDEMIAGVVEHANLFPRIPSSVTRKRTLREVLDGNLSLSAMARLYVQWAAEKKLPRSSVASKRQYVDIVNRNLNISFCAPRKEQCFLCHVFGDKNADPNLREKYASTYRSHRQSREKVKCQKAKDVTDGVRDHSIAVFSYDLQVPLPCPKSDVPCFSYKEKLSVSNLTFLNMIRRVGRCYVWHDGIGLRGSNETTSCVYWYIKDLVRCGYKEIRVWSSNSAGRNRNTSLFAMYVHLAARFSIKIIHRYLQAGHTMMDTDTIHKRIDKATKKVEIFGFDEWIEELEKIEQQFPPFDVVRLTKSHIYSFKELAAKQNWEKDLKGNSVIWKKVREFQVDGNEESLVRIKYELDGESVAVNSTKDKEPVDLKTYRAPQAFTSNIPLSETTSQHVRELLDSDAIPKLNQQFFRDVLAATEPYEGQITDVEYDTEDEICSGELD